MRYFRRAVCCLAFSCVSATIFSAPGIAATTTQDPQNIDPRDLQILAILYIEDNQPHEAIPLLERSIDLYPENGETYMWLGFAQYLTQQFDLSEESLMKALARNPGLTEVHNHLGMLRYAQGDLEAAIREFLVCVGDPVYPPLSKARVRLNLGKVYRELGNLEAAREQLSQGAAGIAVQDQSYGPMHLELAAVLKELGRVQEAIAALQKVVQADDTNVGAHLELGLAYRDISQVPAARRHLQKVIDLAPGTPASESAQVALAGLGLQ